MKTFLRRRSRFLQASVTVVVAISAMAAGAEQARAQFSLFTGWDGGGANDRWDNPQNWSGDVVPDSRYNVALAEGITPNLVIDAEGSFINFPPPAPPVFIPRLLFVNSMAISTANPFTLDGSVPGQQMSRLSLTSGDLTREFVTGAEGDHFLDILVELRSDGLWSVSGGGVLSATSITEVDGSRTFTKTGGGTLAADLFVTGATNINQGVFRGVVSGTSAITVASGGVWQVTDHFSPLPAPIALHGLPGAVFFSSM